MPNAETQRALRVSPVPREKIATMQTWNAALEARSSHRYRQHRKRKKVKRALKQLLVGGISVAIVVIAVLLWRYLVAD